MKVSGIKIKVSNDACFRSCGAGHVVDLCFFNLTRQRRLNMASTNGMIDPEDVVMLLIDHQSGLFNTVKDLPVPDLRNYAIALAKTASLLNIPVLTTATMPDFPNVGHYSERVALHPF